MPDETVNEAAQDAPEILDEDTKNILDELEQEGHSINRPDKPAQPEEPAAKAADQPKDDAPKESEEKPEGAPADKPEAAKPEEESKEEPVDRKPADQKPDDQEPSKREPKMMPTWKHRVAEKQWSQEREELLEKLNQQKGESETPQQKQAIADVEEEVKKLSEEAGLDEGVIQKIVDIASKKNQLPEETLKALDDYKKNQLEAAQESGYSQEFDKDVVPLIRAEYPDISEENLTRIKTELHDVAFSDGYLKTPLKVIYKGLDDFREYVPPARKSAEGGRGEGGRKVDVVDFDNMTEEQFKKLPPEEQDNYMEYMEKKERGN